MNFLTKKTIWNNMELWLFKVCIFSGGIAAGLYFYEDLGKYFILLMLFFMVTAIWSLYLWIKKMNENTTNN